MNYCEKCKHKFTFKDRLKGFLKLSLNHTLKCTQCGAIYIAVRTIYSFIYYFLINSIYIFLLIFLIRNNISNKTIYIILCVLNYFIFNSLYYLIKHKYQKYKLK